LKWIKGKSIKKISEVTGIEQTGTRKKKLLLHYMAVGILH
jgi:tmRNA-binding protein